MRINNSGAIRRLILRYLKSNSKRNSIVITAIALTTFLLTSVFNIGLSFYEAQEVQEKRLMGTTAHITIDYPSPIQINLLKKLDYIKFAGTSNFVASVKNSPAMGDAKLMLYYFDETEWNDIRKPALTDITGSYPLEPNEIMMPRWVLDIIGIEEPFLGMQIELDYQVKTESGWETQKTPFVLSGWYTSFVHLRSGNMDMLPVSKAFSDMWNRSVSEDGSASVVLAGITDAAESEAALNEDLDLTDKQILHFTPQLTVGSSAKAANILAFAIIILLVAFTGYLLIYNVLFITVSRDVRFFGLLKTTGTTPKQLRRIIYGQATVLACIGIPVGCFAAAVLSFIIVPSALSNLSMQMTNRAESSGDVISFSAWIFIGATVFSLLTTWLGASKPARVAAAVSPIEAVRYTNISVKKKKVRVSVHAKPWYMAFKNILREPKRAAVVLLSLFLGITTFLSITVLISGVGNENHIASYIEDDFILINNTVASGSGNVAKQVFNDDFISRVKALPGFSSMWYSTKSYFTITYTEAYEEYLLNFYTTQPDLSKEIIDRFKGNFQSIAIGIEGFILEELNTDLNVPYDINAFNLGEYVLFAFDEEELFAGINNIELTIGETGKTVTLALGGCVPLTYRNDGKMQAPTIIMSNNLMNQLLDNPVIHELHLSVDDFYEKNALDEIKAMTDTNYEISRNSRLEALDSMRQTVKTMYLLGGGIALILALIGVLNFVNVILVGIHERKRELTILESIGMTRYQIRYMLVGEGIVYGVSALILSFSLGLFVSYGIFSLFKRSAGYAVFSIPAIPVAILSVAVLIICALTPVAAFKSFSKVTVVERLKEFD